ncbi:hypothetical protein DICPUDRAFT_49566 [Dictyostelium purpureum]|uniref:Uncharacterized protein n=1 Tax=Dictyostelium purpureum TaxID=5786 RepID=F0ZU64_DICPU|nr:uncharacterized protein DICPUDRAFT_49566 [Dictyostelium purpureum]EGC32515.1 hypothetical protein DICPUDRAFT_49566 [Dictyostelium purpureum]|eukprot:XP_003290965.1 hypothetical protein DICPUDRAFT_49566 [Dictyostelium purpureum]
MVMKLFTYPENNRAFKSLIAAKYAGVEIEVPAFNFQTDRDTEWFKALAPLKKVPVLSTEQGPIFESNAMARYVARLGGNLYGTDAYTAGVNDQWIDYASNEIDPINYGWTYSILGYTDFNSKETQKAKENMKKVLGFLNEQLLNKSFLTGARVQLADVIVFCSLINFYKMVLDPAFRQPFGNVNRWFITMLNQPNVKSVVGTVALCEKMMAYVPPKKEEKPKAEKPKAEEKPKASEEEEVEKPKKKNPLDELPASTFSLDEFKRTYSNNEVSMSIPWFHQNFDANGFSVYYCEYKYNDELGPLFMTCNLIGGFFQRLDSLHKYGFASMIVFGKDLGGGKIENQSVSGIWVFRGNEIPFEMKDCDDSLVYEWKKLDVVADKQLIDNYLAWEGFTDKNFLQGKLYK